MSEERICLEEEENLLTGVNELPLVLRVFVRVGQIGVEGDENVTVGID